MIQVSLWLSTKFVLPSVPFCCVIEKLLDASRCRVDSRLVTIEKSTI